MGNKYDIGNGIRKYRKIAKLSARELAEKVGLKSAQAILQYERNEREPSFEIMMKICEALNIDIVDMCDMTINLKLDKTVTSKVVVTGDNITHTIKQLLEYLNIDVISIENEYQNMRIIQLCDKTTGSKLELSHENFVKLCNESSELIKIFFKSYINSKKSN